MKIFSILLILSFLNTSKTTTNSVDLEVVVTNIKNDRGEVHVALFRKEDQFPDYGKQYKGIIVKAQKDKISVVFKNIPQREYAIAAFHDENKNGKMDKSFVGAPTEDYGFSKNARRMFSAPSFEEAKFDTKSAQKVTFRLD